tara:strand:+ start:5777 stop:6880 length:1104 start_codon:yes stop_codon:yes gene_type:complete
MVSWQNKDCTAKEYFKQNYIKHKILYNIYNQSIDRFWHLIGHTNEIKKSNSYINVNIGIYDLIIYNYKNVFKAYINSCPHRGCKIKLKKSGNSPLVCPYHGWSFNPSGTVIPRLKSFENLEEAQSARLIEWKLEIVGGFIFIANDPKYNLNLQIGNEVFSLLKKIGENLNNLYSHEIITSKCHWTIAVENALEPYHLSMVHSDSLNKLKLDDGINIINEWTSLWKAEIRSKKIFNSLRIIKSAIKDILNISGYWSLYIFPFSQLSSTGGLSFALQSFNPGKHAHIEETKVSTKLFVPKIEKSSLSTPLTEFWDSSSKINRIIFEEDAEICSHIPLDSWDINPLNFSSDLEVKINHFRSCCSKVTSNY